MTKLNCFKAYDIRGRLGDELNEDIAYRIGRAYAQVFKPAKMIVGGDARATSSALKLALADGLMDGGADVLDIGMVGTEEVYFATFFSKVDGGIEVTASHNPIDYNGMKPVGKESRPISADTGLNDIQKLAEINQFEPVGKRGSLQKTSFEKEYIQHLMGYITPKNFKPLKLVINSGNGAAGHVIDAIEQAFNAAKMPITIIKVHNEPDSSFPNGIPNPLLLENRQDTIDAVIKHKADMGIAFDGDFDRCFMFDESGAFIDGYYIVGLLAEAFLAKNKGAKIVYDPRLVWNTIEIVEKAGGVPIMCKSGHSFIKAKMRKEDAVYGGELSAHHYFKNFSYCDSGMIPWLLVAELLCVKSQKLSALVNDCITAYPNSGEINLKLADAQKAIANVRDHFAADLNSGIAKLDETDGISIELDQWRFNLRTSNTEPVVRLNVETRANKNLLTEKTQIILDILKR